MRIRIEFTKTGALRYVGNLDLHTLWERAARRAALPLAYSQGFHPQPKLHLASPLPLGYSSRCEVLDMLLNEDVDPSSLAERLQAVLPPGIRVLKVESTDPNGPALQALVTSAEYAVGFHAGVPGSDLQERIDRILAEETLPRERRGKSYDLRPLIQSLRVDPSSGGAQARIHMRLTAREGATGRPDEVMEALGFELEDVNIERTSLIFGG
jgi:radical SAM-linked protein